MAENTEGEMTEKKTDTDKPQLFFKELGRSGTLVMGKQIDDEYLNELKGVKGQEQYDKMLRSDSKIRQTYHAVSNPIRSAKWEVGPGKADEQGEKIAALIKHILFNNVPDGWLSKLDEILTFPWHGHSVFEVVHQNRTDKVFGPYTGLKNFAFRDQKTLTEWKFEDGILKTVRQQQSGDLDVDVEIPAENLVIFFNEKKGDDLGYAFLRMLYGNYKRKLLYKQLQAIGMERGAIPVPFLKVPGTVDYGTEQWILAENQLKAFTQAETAYFILPNGWDLTFQQTNTFDPGKAQVAIKAENEEIAGSLVAMFLEMGVGGNSGNQAGTSVSAKFFTQGIEYIANKICETINLKLIPNLVRLNFGDVAEEYMPKLAHAGIAEEAGEELMKIVTGYVKDGVIIADESLEAHVRKQHNLPKKDEGFEVVDPRRNKTPPALNPEDPNDPNKPAVPGKPAPGKPSPDDDKDLSLKPHTIDFAAKKNDVQKLMSSSAKKISEVVRTSLQFSGNKFINDTMNRAKQLPESRKQEATNKVVVGGAKKFRDELKVMLSEAAALAIDGARKEIPSKKDVELNSAEADFVRLTEKYGDLSEIKFSEFSSLPAHIQVLIAKQADLISEQHLNDLKAKLSFTYSSIDLRSKDANVVKQNMEEALAEAIESNKVVIAGENVAALMVNEGRSSFFFEPDVLEEIHSFTFMNGDPKSPICKELAGKTFNTNDAESLRYSPPLHHNCKSYLRANLKTSKGVDKLEVTTLSPTDAAVKSITL